MKIANFFEGLPESYDVIMDSVYMWQNCDISDILGYDQHLNLVLLIALPSCQVFIWLLSI